MDTLPSANTLIAMPAYNEEKYIGSMVLKVRQYADETLVIDDGSTDRTAEIAEMAGATVIRHEENSGKGTAIQTILVEARKKSTDVLVILDADSQHNPEEIPTLIKPIQDGYDLVIGSRLQQAGKTPHYRRLGQKVLAYMTHILTKESSDDTESGFRALSRKAISELQLREKGFAIETEMIANAIDKGLKIHHVPISNIYTQDGSTLNPVRHGLGVLIRILTMISERRPLAFFGLGGLVMVTLGLIMGIIVIQMFATNNILPVGYTVLTSVFLIIGMFSIFTSIILHVMANIVADSIRRAVPGERESSK
jgi:glycosyltransferase involved in cell wall biosynthesis